MTVSKQPTAPTGLIWGRVVLIVISVLAMAVAAVATDARSTHGFTASSVHGSGVVSLESDADNYDRTVEAWIHADGRYRVIVSTVGFEDSEEAIFDGGIQRVIVTDRTGQSGTVIGDFTNHFVVNELASVPGAVVTTRDPATGRASEAVAHGDGYTYTLKMEWSAERVSDQDLEPSQGAYPPTIKASRQAGTDPVEIVPVGPVQALSGSDSRSTTMYGATGACVYAYNFRNLSSGYFRGASTYRTACWYMFTNLRAPSQLTGGNQCSLGSYLGDSGTHAQHASVIRYTSPANEDETCSTHTGWDTDWNMWVSYKGLNGYPN